MLTWENTWCDIERARPTMAVVPIGATEQHGTNLPLMTDSMVVTRLAEAVAEAFGAYLVPTIPIGMSATHLSFPGTLSLSHQTLAAVIDDIVDSLERTGFTTVLFLSWHGGNYVLFSDHMDDLRRRHPRMNINVVLSGQAGMAARRAAGVESEEWHAGETEASVVASMRPDLLGPEPTDFPNPRAHIHDVPVTSETGFPQDVRQVSPSGALGEPSLGTKEKGDRFFDIYLPLLIEGLRRELGE